MNMMWRKKSGTGNGGETSAQADASGRAMNGLAKPLALFLLFAGLLLGATNAMAAACTSVASGIWSAQTTWGAAGTGCVGATGGIPGAVDTVTIGATHTVTLTANAAASTLTIAAATAANGVTLNGFTLNVGGAVVMTAVSTNAITSTFNVGTGMLTATSITINGGAGSRIAQMTVSTGTITTTGNIAFAGTAANARFVSTGASMVNVGGNFASGGTLTTTGTGTINFNGGAAQTIGAYATYNNITINKTAGSVALAGNATIGGALSVNTGTLTVGAFTLAVTGVTTVNSSISITSTTGTKTFTGNVIINSGGTLSETVAEPITYGGNLTINNGGTLTEFGAATMTCAGSLQNDGTYTASTGVHTFSGATKTLSGVNPIAIPSVAVTGTYTNSGTLTVGTALSGAGSLTNTATLNIGGTSSITTLANAGTATITGAGAISTALTNFTNSGTLNLNGTGTITGITNNGIINLTSSGTITALTNNAAGTLNISTTPTVPTITTLTATAAGNTVNYSGAGNQTIKATTYSNLGLSGSGAKAMGATTINGNFTMSGTATTAPTGALTVGGSFSIGASNTFANGANALNVAGNFNQSGTFTAGAGVVTLNGGAAVQTISGAGPLGFANLTISNTGGITLARNVTVTSAIIGAYTLTSTCPTDYTLTSNGGALVEHSCAASVVSINRADPSPTSAASVSWMVTFNTSVSGLSSSNFTLVNSGLGGAPAITGVVNVSGNVWTVTASTGTGTGTLGLNMANAIGVTPTVINLPFTGQVYSIVGAGVINTYYPGTASVLAGATSITLGAATGAATPIATGDLLLIMQMQDATIDSTNTATYGTVSGTPTAGKYEYAIAASAVPLGGGTLSLLPCGTLNAYTNAAYIAGSSGQKRFQVIRVPVYASYTINAITASAWNGSTGGVLAFDVTGALTLNSATVTVDGMGFRGGASRTLAGGAGVNTDYLTLATVNNNASKGEGIAGTPFYVFTAPSTLTNTAVEGYPNGSHARGAPANGGGGGTDINPVANDQNSGGGGGANGGAGGLGGIGWCPTFNTTAPTYGCGLPGLVSPSNPGGSTGGIGGSAVAGLGAARLTLGGGGGGGTTNNGTGALAGGLSSSGAAGGGIIMLRAGSMTGAATFNANGSGGDNTVCNDGGAGGGAGGVVLISAGSGVGGVTINVKGGKGGDTLAPPCAGSTPHGPGGGGGGGYAITTGVPAASSAASGANGVTYNGGVSFGAYGAMAGSAGSLNSGLTAAAIPGVALGATSCTSPLDHLEIQHASGTGLTCAASTLTIRACADAACTLPYTGGVSGTLTAAGAGMTVNWDGTTGGAAGAGFAIPNGGSSVTKNVQVATAGSVVFGITSPSPLPANATTCNFGVPVCTFTANLAGFIFSDTTTSNSYTIPPQASGIATPTLYLRAVQASTTNPAVCTPAIINQPNVSVNMGYVCNNPASCQAGNLATINTTAIAPTGTAVSLNFDANGSAPITARYDDVGQVTLNANKTVTPFGGATAVTLTGSSNPFVVAPHHFDFSNITPGLIKAGSNFSATVTAYNGLATPAATPNFGKESVAEGVTLTSSLVSPVGGNNPAIGSNVIPGNEFGAGGMVNDANGVATVNNLSWGEVGIITLTANLTSGSYLGSALNATGTSANVGRFIPDHFDTVTSGGMPCPTGLTCPTQFNGFVYSGQPFTTQVIARNLAGGTTFNYDSARGYSKAVTLSAWNAAGGAVANPGGGTLNPNAVPSTAFNLGMATTSTPIYMFPATPVASTDIYVRAAESFGGDGVTSLRVSSVEGGIKVVSGRAKLSNAHGSELLSLPMTATVQYWSGANWVTSTTDDVTSFNTAADIVASIVKGPLASVSVAGAGVVTVVGGVKTFILNKPLVTGSADISLSSPGYLLAGSNGAAINPSKPGRATFGVYKGSNEFIYLRETY